MHFKSVACDLVNFQVSCNWESGAYCIFLGINHNMVDSFHQNSNPSLDLWKNNIIQWEGGPSRSIFFVKRSVSLSNSSWQLGIGYCETFDLEKLKASVPILSAYVGDVWWWSVKAFMSYGDQNRQTDRRPDRQTSKALNEHTCKISKKFWQVIHRRQKWIDEV